MSDAWQYSRKGREVNAATDSNPASYAADKDFMWFGIKRTIYLPLATRKFAR